MKRREALEYFRRVEPALVPVAAPALGVCCEVCRSGVSTGYSRCSQCYRHDVPRVLPISMSVHQSQLHHRLRNYKAAPSSEGRREHSLVLAALLGLFLERHQECLGGMHDYVVTVPSPSRDALDPVVSTLRGLSRRRIEALRAIGTSTRPEYELVAPRMDGRVVLLLDDTFTSGQSIAAAHRVLSEGGAKILGPLVIGRHFRPDFPTSIELWSCLQAHKWSLDRCGLCGPVNCHPDQSRQTMF